MWEKWLHLPERARRQALSKRCSLCVPGNRCLSRYPEKQMHMIPGPIMAGSTVWELCLAFWFQSGFFLSCNAQEVL